MKKLFITIAAILIGAAFASAQDLASVTETYNYGANSIAEGNKAEALQAFREALAGAELLGADGEEIATKCKTYIPELEFSIAKELVNNQDYDNAIAALKATIAVAKEYGANETAESAADLIPQVLMQKANAFLAAKDFAAAVDGYKAVLEADPNNGVAALRLGSALNSAGDKDAAIEAFKLAAANGQDKQAVKQISNIYLKNAAAALKAKDYAGIPESQEEQRRHRLLPEVSRARPQCRQRHPDRLHRGGSLPAAGQQGQGDRVLPEGHHRSQVRR